MIWSRCSFTYQRCIYAVWSWSFSVVDCLLHTCCMSRLHCFNEKKRWVTRLWHHVGVCVCVCTCTVCMGMHATTLCSNPAAFVFLTYKLQNDPSEKLLPQRTVQPSAPPWCSWAACVCVVCVNVCSLCVSVLDLFLWLWRWTGRGEDFFFQDIWEWWIRRTFFFLCFGDYCLETFLKVREGGSWILRKKQPSQLLFLRDTSHAGIGVWSSVSLLWVRTLSDHHKTRFNFCPGRNRHDCWVCLCFCEPDPTVLLTGSSKHVIVLKQMMGWNGAQQTRVVLLSG